MAEIYKTTLTPSKLELLTAWLPRQPWYRGGGTPVLAKAGGFRLDDPDGEVGIEFVFVRDEADGQAIVYHAPLSYRGRPLDGAEDALVGNSEHGVLGTRWVYDGAHDPVVVAQLVALLRGEAEPQEQSVSFTANPSVVASLDSAFVFEAGTVVNDGPDGTRLGSAAAAAAVRIIRLLGTSPDTGAGRVTADWQPGEDLKSRGPVVVVES